MFDVVFWNDLQHSNRTYVARRVTSLSGARDARQVSGDLVVYAGSDDVVQSEDWLWGWEREARAKSYAWRHAAHADAQGRPLKMILSPVQSTAKQD
jgi:hypothetical protein